LAPTTSAGFIPIETNATAFRVNGFITKLNTLSSGLNNSGQIIYAMTDSALDPS
jgi:hypothetical protein